MSTGNPSTKMSWFTIAAPTLLVNWYAAAGSNYVRSFSSSEGDPLPIPVKEYREAFKKFAGQVFPVKTTL